MGHHHHEKHRKDHDIYGNPNDLAEYLRKLEGDDRAEWQKPDEVVAALGLKATDLACELGSGPGYFSLRLARAAAHVFAVDAEPRMLELLRERITKAGVHNVTPVLALESDPLLPPASCDVVLMVNAFHHFGDGVGYLRRVARALKPGGRIVNIDFGEGDIPVGPEPEHRVARGEFLRIAEEAGLSLAGEQRFLPYQYFLALRPR